MTIYELDQTRAARRNIHNQGCQIPTTNVPKLARTRVSKYPLSGLPNTHYQGYKMPTRTGCQIHTTRVAKYPKLCLPNTHYKGLRIPTTRVAKYPQPELPNIHYQDCQISQQSLPEYLQLYTHDKSIRSTTSVASLASVANGRRLSLMARKKLTRSASVE